LDRAEILAGAKFDMKVEFPGAPVQGAVRVTINGADATTATAKPASFVEREDGGDYSAYCRPLGDREGPLPHRSRHMGRRGRA
jgi:alkaline phosphatase